MFPIPPQTDESSLRLVYFCSDPSRASQALRAGVDAILIDCEFRGKQKRQQNQFLEINQQRPEDVRPIRLKNSDAQLLCRVNNHAQLIKTDIDRAISAGASGIVLPMVETVDVVEQALEIINGRATLSIMLETNTGLKIARALRNLPFNAWYVGLNDLKISRSSSSLFWPLVDGTINKLMEECHISIGVGGVSDPQQKLPVSTRQVIGEYETLGVSSSVLRRSFDSAAKKRPIENIVSDIKECFRIMSLRSTTQRHQDSSILYRKLQDSEMAGHKHARR